MSKETEDALYADEPWAILATRHGFRPYDTESSARRAFEACVPMMEALQAVMDLQPDGDGDVSFFADEHGFNPMLHKIGVALGVSKPLVIEVLPMTAEETVANFDHEVTHWDVLVRPDGGDPIREFENLTREEADLIITKMEGEYPQAEVNDSVLH